ncbi:MAG: signal peptide peptidase SppA [Candidatus Diapherotrites archaeon CG11_big_fil_rev_8_21_14_0_20_37_9]|nr:MAG: signal peptide peptidase SppA [Candidatus Diapherotrites archaeon CG11_big_fil_rev_8_21_14_0_20_37_9]
MVEKKLPEDLLIVGIVGMGLIFLALVIVIVVLFPVGNGIGASGVGVIPLKGEISNQGSGSIFEQSYTANDIVDLIDDAENDSSVGVIFLDIDSPGGEVVASKQIVYKLRSVEKPTFAYIGSVGASGAYYVAAATDYIVADEDSITGSIGVISTVMNFEELFDNLGIKVTLIKEGKFKAIGSPFKEFTKEEQKLIQDILQETAIGFKADVFEFRKDKMERSELDAVADGRIMSGRQALKSHLVDELLTKEEALQKAAELNNLKNSHIVYFGLKEPGFFDLIFASGSAFGQGFMSELKPTSSSQVELK